MTSPAIKLAKECGAFTDALYAGRHDNTVLTTAELTRFHAKAQAQALRDAAEWFDVTGGPLAAENLRRMAEELEKQTSASSNGSRLQGPL